jgi:hypothetical protein
MFRALTAIAICVFAFGANAQPSEEDKLCIFSAAEKLPSIPGLEITASRVKPLPTEVRKRSEHPSKVSAVKVEIDIKAAAQEGTYEFVCSRAPGQPVFISPAGLSGRYPVGNSPPRGTGQGLDERLYRPPGPHR